MPDIKLSLHSIGGGELHEELDRALGYVTESYEDERFGDKVRTVTITMKFKKSKLKTSQLCLDQSFSVDAKLPSYTQGAKGVAWVTQKGAIITETLCADTNQMDIPAVRLVVDAEKAKRGQA